MLSPEIHASQHAGELSSGEAEGEPEGNSTHADEGEDDAYCEGDDRGGDHAVHFREQFDPENPLEIDWSGFKYLSQSTSSHVSVRSTQLPPCFTSKMS